MTDAFTDPSFRESIYKFNNTVLEAAKLFTSETGRKLANAELQSDSRGGLAVSLKCEAAPSGPKTEGKQPAELRNPSKKDLFELGVSFYFSHCDDSTLFKYCDPGSLELPPVLLSYDFLSKKFRYAGNVFGIREDHFITDCYSDRTSPGSQYIPFGTLIFTDS